MKHASRGYYHFIVGSVYGSEERREQLLKIISMSDKIK
jgi:hypothetical protein